MRGLRKKVRKNGDFLSSTNYTIRSTIRVENEKLEGEGGTKE
jgi:hypothetical protein